MRRRHLLLGGSAAALAGAAAITVGTGGRGVAGTGFEIDLTPEEWRERLTEAEFAVLRQEATERPFTSPLNDNKAAGTYVCAGCANPLYASETKFDSGTGWPSFYAAIEGGVGTKVDYKLILPRTEVHCARCGGHLGHVFDDGPAPTGKRHCINGVALDFVAA